jgi:uncharacterized protein (TIGR02594 family)
MKSKAYDNKYGSGAYETVISVFIQYPELLGGWFRGQINLSDGFYIRVPSDEIISETIDAPGVWLTGTVMVNKYIGFGKISSRKVETPWMTIAESQLGVTEIPGSNHNPKIISYHATTGGFKDDETPWCSSFVNWSLNQSGIKGTQSARALSWFGWGQSLKKPAFGSIAIIDYGNGKGHVGFVAGVNQNGSIVLLGGNQSNMVKYSAFSPSSINWYVYPVEYTPGYFLPNLTINRLYDIGNTR